MSVEILFDVAQDRIVRDRMASYVTGELLNARGEPIPGWGAPEDGNCYVEPTRQRLILCPLPFLPAWQTNTGGLYARLQVSDLRNYNGGSPIALSGSDWITTSDRASGDYWIELVASGGNPGITIVTNATYAANRGFYFEQFNAASSQDKATYTEVGFYRSSDTPDTGSIKLRLYQSGEVWVYRYGALVAKGNRTGPATPQAAPLEKVGYIILPCPPRDIIVLTSDGQGFCHTLQIGDEETITDDNSRFFVRHPAPQAVKFQLAPLTFASTGYVSGVTSVFQEPPPSGSTATLRAIYDVPGYGTEPTVAASLREVGSSSMFTPDGVKREAQIRLTLTGDGTNTPIVHAASAEYDAEIDSTPDASTDVVPFITELHLSVPEQVQGTELQITLKNPDALEAAGVIGARTMASRPVRCAINGWTVLDGVADAPRALDRATSETQRVHVRVRDWTKLLENQYLPDDVVHDGAPLHEELARLLRIGGIPDEAIYIPDMGYTIPASESPSQGEWSVVTRAGTSILAGFTNLIDSYCPNAFVGIVPNAGVPQFQVVLPESFDEFAAATLYRTTEDAMGLGGWGEAEASAHVFRDWQTEILEPEANDIWVTGLDRRTGRPIVVHYPDRESQDPTLDPEARPTNWLGSIRRYGLYDPNLPTLEACIRAAELLYQRLTPARVIDEFLAELQLWPDGYPVWRGAMFELWDGTQTIETRLQSFSGRFDLVDGWQEMRYICERQIGERVTGRLGIVGQTVQAIRESQAYRLAFPTIIYRNGGERLEGLRPQEIVTLPLE